MSLRPRSMLLVALAAAARVAATPPYPPPPRFPDVAHILFVAGPGHATKITLPSTGLIRPGAVVRWLSPAYAQGPRHSMTLPTDCSNASPASYAIDGEMRVQFPASGVKRGW
mmetsp:Transcript_16009/g.39328  ORF Transcript_16009/g.39328 Transcript_16009/m.39328 type:complete len:112 (+) Transcript_16009:147-482(+)